MDFALVWRPDDHSENPRLRQMLQEFRPPVWGQGTVITADNAYAPRATLTLIQELGYGYVVTLPVLGSLPTGKPSRPW